MKTKVSLLTLATATLLSSMASAQMASGSMSRNNMITPSLSNMENPMYKPGEGMFYSKTNFNYTPVDKHDDSYALTEEFGYGLGQDWALSASIGYGWMSKAANLYDKDSQVSNLAIAGLYRPVANQDLVWDITAGVSIDIADDMVDQYSLSYPIDDYGKKDTGAPSSAMFEENVSEIYSLPMSEIITPGKPQLGHCSGSMKTPRSRHHFTLSAMVLSISPRRL